MDANRMGSQASKSCGEGSEDCRILLTCGSFSISSILVGNDKPGGRGEFVWVFRNEVSSKVRQPLGGFQTRPDRIRPAAVFLSKTSRNHPAHNFEQRHNKFNMDKFLLFNSCILKIIFCEASETEGIFS